VAERKNHVRHLKGTLLLIGILGLGSVVALFVMHQHKAPSGQSGGAGVIEQKATISLDGVHHTAIKNGAKDWSLEAESADYRLEDSEAVFKTLHVTFYSKEGDGVFLSADSGIWHTESNDLDVIGHVMIKNRQYAVQAEKLRYIHERRILTSLTPVNITGEALKISADKMEYNLDGNLIHLNGNVIGMIGEDIGL
jgi:LPS export ABC transporter protein LptC